MAGQHVESRGLFSRASMLPRPDSRRRRRLLPQMEKVLSWTRVGAVNSMAFSLARQKMANWTIKLTRHGRCPNYQEGINRGPNGNRHPRVFPRTGRCPLPLDEGGRGSFITYPNDGRGGRRSQQGKRQRGTMMEAMIRLGSVPQPWKGNLRTAWLPGTLQPGFNKWASYELRMSSFTLLTIFCLLLTWSESCARM